MKPKLGLPKTGCDEGAAIAEVNEKVGPDDVPIDDPNSTGGLLVTEAEGADAANENPDEGDVVAAAAVDVVKGNTVEDELAAAEAVDTAQEKPADGDVAAGTKVVDAGKENNVVAGIDAGKEKPVEGVVVAATEAVDAEKEEPAEADIELNAEPKIGGFVGCQLELNKLEEEPPMALLEFASGEEAEEPSPKAEPELKSLAVVEAENRELPEEEAVLPANPNEGADELNCTGMQLVRDETPVPASDAFILCTDSLPVPKTEEPD